MNLQPSTSVQFNERRLLFAQELNFGGHGQVYLSGAGTYTPSPDYVFYQFDFFTSTTLTNVVFRSVNSDGEPIYQANAASYAGVVFPAGTTWSAPATSITISGGTGIAYQYKKFIPEELFCI